MAFAFTVEDGTGLIAANSYVSVGEADDIASINIHTGDNWAALDLETKEKLLSWASQFLDNHVRWKGQKANNSSGMRWPRENVHDRDGWAIPKHVIPQQLKVATAAFAVFLMDGDCSAEGETEGLVRLKADVVELEFQEGYKQQKVPSHISHLLTGLGTVSNGIGFGRIIR